MTKTNASKTPHSPGPRRGLPPVARAALAALGACGAGAIAGAVLAAVGRYVYVPSVWPAVGAVAVGAGVMALIRALRLPGGARGAAIGGLGGGACVVSTLLVAWAVERAAVVSELSRTGGLQGDALAARASALLSDRAGTGPLAPLMLRVNDGVSFVSGMRLNLGPAGNSALLGIELLLATGLAARLGFVQARRPYSQANDAWLTRRVVGSAAHGSAATIRAELRDGQYHRLGRRLGPPADSAPVTLCVWVCDGGEADVQFELEVVEAGSRKPRVVETKAAPHSALDAILESQALLESDRAGARHG